MGWTRPRVVQVIAELESRGLVEMREERIGRGRPRKLYRLTPAADFRGPAVVDQAVVDQDGDAEPSPSDTVDPT
jgi:predicted ArsR family transcriptional regulator